VINEGMQVLHEVETLNGGLSDTIKAVAEEMEIKPGILKKAIKLDKGSSRPHADKVGKITRAQLEEIAKTKMKDMTAADLDAKVEWLLGRLMDKSPTAIRKGKYAMRITEQLNFDQSAIFMEGQIGTLALTEDAEEGLKAFNEKRKPNWTGR